MTLDDIIGYCQSHGQVPWLKKAILNEEGKAVSFIELKLLFCREFMPEILPKGKPKKPSMLERIMSL